jgi:hypothetical protein
MRLVFVAGCALAGMSLATSAFADSQTVATLQQPVAKRIQFVANQAIWDCEGSSCVAANARDMYFGASECHEVARRAGTVSEFKNDIKALQQPDLERCNAGVGSAQAKTPTH